MGNQEKDGFSLVIECGPHAGVTRQLSAGTYRIGSGLGGDLVLADPAMEWEHLDVSLSAGLLGAKILVCPLHGTVFAAEQSIGAGARVSLALPVELTLGHTRVVFFPPPRLEQRKSFIYGGVIAAGALVAFMAFFADLVGWRQPSGGVTLALDQGSGRSDALPAPPFSEPGEQDERTSGEVLADIAPASPEPAEGVDHGAMEALIRSTAKARGGRIEVIDIGFDAFRLNGYLPARSDLVALVETLRSRFPLLKLVETRIATLDGAIKSLHTRLLEAGLGESLKVAPGESTIIVSGEIRQNLEAAWRSVHSWFDARYGGQIVLDSRVTIRSGPEGPALSIRAIWTGDAPYIIAGNGQKYSVGSVLDSGWRIERIGPDTIELSRSGDTLHLSL